MARFLLVSPFYCTPNGNQPQKLSPGATIASDAGSALVGDYVVPGLAQTPNNQMVALDSAAVALFAAVGITVVVGQRLSSPTGLA
jgi:hypothetical protein